MQPFADHFSTQAEQYARYRPRYPQALFDLLLANTPGQGHAWDCATGNGQVAVELAPYFERVTATDASAAQISHALACPKVEFRVASAEESGLPDRSIDLLTVATAIHWFNLDLFYEEARRVLRPNGLLAVWTYSPRVEGPLAGKMRQLSEDILGRDWPEGYKAAYDGYRELPFPFHQLPCPDLSIDLDWSRAELLGWLDTWSGVRRYRARTNEDPLPAWAEGLPDRQTLRLPLALKLGRVLC